jgi:hypothetical protein
MKQIQKFIIQDPGASSIPVAASGGRLHNPWGHRGRNVRTLPTT